MKTPAELFDLARERAGWSDYRIAKEAGVRRQQVSMIRHGHMPISEPVADAVGRAIGKPGGYVYAEARAARAKRTDQRQFWERVARGLAASVALVFVVVLAQGPSAGASAAAVDHVIHYAH